MTRSIFWGISWYLLFQVKYLNFLPYWSIQLFQHLENEPVKKCKLSRFIFSKIQVHVCLCYYILLCILHLIYTYIFIKCETNKNNETWKHEKMGMKFNELNLMDEIKY
jgi:hypothetical protein